MIPETHPTWEIIDGSKIDTFMSCPRKFFFEYVLGWRSIFPQHALHFGQAVHFALEHMYHVWKTTGRYTDEATKEGFNLFLEHYRLQFTGDTDDEFNPKEPGNTLLCLRQYTEKYQQIDNFEVIYTEISGSVPIGVTPEGKDKRIYFRTDTVCKDDRGAFILEHKTTGWQLDKWSNAWPLCTQAGTGNHLLYCIFDPKEVYGMIFNGLFFKRPPRMKKDGTPYANASKGNFFHRVPIRHTPESMQAWLSTTEFWYDEIQRHFDLLDSEITDQPVMNSFPKCHKACQDYGILCKFHPYCSAWHNPLKDVDNMPQDWFKLEYWDPREGDKEHTEKVEV